MTRALYTHLLTRTGDSRIVASAPTRAASAGFAMRDQKNPQALAARCDAR
jgi:hypothetical protein